MAYRFELKTAGMIVMVVTLIELAVEIWDYSKRIYRHCQEDGHIYEPW